MKPSTLKGKILTSLGWIVGISVAIAAIMAYMVFSFDSDGRRLDGLGRVLSPPPLWARFFLGQQDNWKGLAWHVIDMVWFFGGIALAAKFFGLAHEEKEASEKTDRESSNL